MIELLEVGDAQQASVLGRTSPLVKLGLALAWLVGLALTLDPRPPAVLVGAAVLAGTWFGSLSPARLIRGIAPLWLAAIGIAVFNTLFSGSNADPAALEAFRLGPFRITERALVAGVALGARVFAIAAVGVVFAQTTDPTRLVDALVQQGRVSGRFAYGALAAYGAIPRFAQDLATLRAARRIRGLRGSWHPRLLVGLLVLAIRHADRMALAMDARAFGSGPRTRYREVRWTRLDAIVAAAGLAVLIGALLTAR